MKRTILLLCLAFEYLFEVRCLEGLPLSLKPPAEQRRPSDYGDIPARMNKCLSIAFICVSQMISPSLKQQKSHFDTTGAVKAMLTESSRGSRGLERL